MQNTILDKVRKQCEDIFYLSIATNFLVATSLAFNSVISGLFSTDLAFKAYTLILKTLSTNFLPIPLDQLIQTFGPLGQFFIGTSILTALLFLQKIVLQARGVERTKAFRNAFLYLVNSFLMTLLAPALSTAFGFCAKALEQFLLLAGFQPFIATTALIVLGIGLFAGTVFLITKFSDGPYKENSNWLDVGVIAATIGFTSVLSYCLPFTPRLSDLPSGVGSYFLATVPYSIGKFRQTIPTSLIISFVIAPVNIVYGITRAAYFTIFPIYPLDNSGQSSLSTNVGQPQKPPSLPSKASRSQALVSQQPSPSIRPQEPGPSQLFKADQQSSLSLSSHKAGPSQDSKGARQRANGKQKMQIG